MLSINCCGCVLAQTFRFSSSSLLAQTKNSETVVRPPSIAFSYTRKPQIRRTIWASITVVDCSIRMKFSKPWQRFPRPCRLAFSCTAVVNMGRWIHLPTVEATVGRCNRNGFKTLMVRRCLFSSSSKEPSHCHCCRHCCLRCLVVAVAIAKATGVHYQRVTITKRNRVTRAFRLPPQQHEGIRIHLIESGRRTD